MNTLRARVLVAMASIAVLSSLVTATVTRSQTVAAVEDAAAVSVRTESIATDTILNHGLHNSDWADLAQVVDELAMELGTRIAVSSTDGRVLADSDPGADLPARETAVIDVRFAGSITDDAVVNVDTANGAEILSCLEDLATDPSISDDEEDAPEQTPLGGGRTLDDCIGLAEADNLVDTAPPVLLYLGYPLDDGVDLGSLELGRTLLALSVVVLIAGLASTLVAHRLSRPLKALTAAVNSVTDGDLSQRVEINGQDDVATLARSFNSMADRLGRAERTRARMVSDIAHELRSPVGVLQGNLEAAQDGLFDIDTDLIDHLHTETLHLSRLVDDLQQLALADAGVLNIHRSRIELSQAIGAVVEAYRPTSDEAQVEITTELPPEIYVDADPARIRQILGNLLSNAIRYTPADGRISVTLRARDGLATISVADTGIGIAPEDLDNVFNRFWRADASRDRHTGGSGIGLAVCRELVAGHSGTITAQSQLGIGSTFTVELPIALHASAS